MFPLWDGKAKKETDYTTEKGQGKKDFRATTKKEIQQNVLLTALGQYRNTPCGHGAGRAAVLDVTVNTQTQVKRDPAITTTFKHQGVELRGQLPCNSKSTILFCHL